MKIQYIFLSIFFLTCCCYSQSIVCLKTGEIHLGEFLELDSATVLIQFYGIDNPQKLAIEQIERLIFLNRRVLIQNGVKSVGNDMSIGQQEQIDLIANSTTYLIPVPDIPDDRITFFAVKDATLQDKFEILVTINDVIWVGELVKINPSDVEFRPFNSNVSQRVKNKFIQRLILPDPEDFYADIDITQLERNSISYQEYRAMIQEVGVTQKTQPQMTETLTDKRDDLILRDVPELSFSGAKKVYTIVDNKGYRFKHVELVSLDNNMLYFRYQKKILSQNNFLPVTLAVNQIRSIMPISKKISMTATGCVGGMIIGAIVGMTDEYLGGPVIAILGGFVFGTMGTGIGLIIDIPFWIYDETQRVNLMKLSRSKRMTIINKFINNGGKL